MKKEYCGLLAEKISFETSGDIITQSPNCIQVVANQVEGGAQECSNPTDTTSYIYLGDNPYGE